MFLLFSLLVFSATTWAAGGFEKPVLWSASAAQHGGAYVSAVNGAEALLFNPAGLIAENKKEFHLGISAASGSTESPIVENKKTVKTFSGPVTPLGLMYAQQLDTKQAIGIGIYSIGGLDVGFNKVDLSSQGEEFNNYKPDVFGRLSVLELGLGYSRKINSNLSFGGTLRQHYASGGFSQLQVSQAKGLGGFGIPDGTVLAVSKGEFDDLKGYSIGSYLLGAKYLSDDRKTGVALTYRSQVDFDLKTKGSGEIVYSASGSAVSGATAGEVNQMAGNQTTISSSIPEAWTISGFRKITQNNTAHFEYTWTEYSHNKKLAIDGNLTNPVDNTTTAVSDMNLNWHDMQDFKFGWTNTSIDSWILGGGYSITLPVTNKDYAGPTFAAPGNYQHFYVGLGKAFTNFRVDAAYEYYFGAHSGKTERIETANTVSPSVEGLHATKAYAFFFSMSYYL
jgi:long-subunit fatty acid transport protein